MMIVGLTGSIGMGKSTAADMLREMGIPIHDADATVHKLMGPGGAAVSAIAALCPESLKTDADGRDFIDRKILGKHIFADPGLKSLVEGTLYPMVQASEDAFIAEKTKEGYRMVVLDVPLLFETGWDARVDKTICVSAPAEVQRIRVLARPGMTEERLADVLKAQMPDAEKRACSDFVVDTGVGFDDTRRQLKDIVAALLPAPKSKPRGPRP
ncbi:MAG: dephospho-CoA kinase [Alphaproteobacteria bacterium]|nr:MAG: dephospho-CoA kinase [Alphaproteobacteria bacterium]